MCACRHAPCTQTRPTCARWRSSRAWLRAATPAQGWGADLGLDVAVRQTDDEAELVGWLHEAVDTRSHVVLNPAAFTHYSYALRDAAALEAALDARLAALPADGTLVLDFADGARYALRRRQRLRFWRRPLASLS